MCRLVAYDGAPLSLETLFFRGDHPLSQQSWAPRELLSGTVNVDGYGVAWLGSGGQLRRLARVEPIWHDPDLPGLLGELRAPRALAALRNATPGLPVGRTGLLPLLQDGWAMAMNGFIPGFRSRHMRELRAELTDARYGRIAGSSDAETLFFRLLDLLDQGHGVADALVSVRDAVAARLGPDEVAPLTLVVMGRNSVTAIHTTLHGPVNSLYLSRPGGLAPEGVILASEPLDSGMEWSAVPAHSVVEIQDGQATVSPL